MKIFGDDNQCSKFSPSLAENTKESLSTDVTLDLYDPNRESVVSADASSTLPGSSDQTMIEIAIYTSLLPSG